MWKGWLLLGWFQQMFTYRPVVAQSKPVSGSQTGVSATSYERHGNPSTKRREEGISIWERHTASPFWRGTLHLHPERDSVTPSERGTLYLYPGGGCCTSIWERDNVSLSWRGTLHLHPRGGCSTSIRGRDAASPSERGMLHGYWFTFLD